MQMQIQIDSQIIDLPTGRFNGSSEFSHWLRLGLLAAEQNAWRELILSDHDFSDWHLGEASIVQTLHAWAKTGGKLTLLAHHFNIVERRHEQFDLFLQWRRNWAHQVHCCACQEIQNSPLPSAVWSPHWMLLRQDPLHNTGLASESVQAHVQLHEKLQTYLRLSHAALPISVLGL